ncbi:ECF RNA polymerase sigma-E factor [Enhygromyxa salina]|uniref:ECF RNA polymerase sigma-E factor n=1 Tax=Enhygromyxa salina TaxID=215803 RepID=A0A2S9XJQ7_9BACT|nr:RNA polymerase sigma factor [Enhygromyxa salina]PRP93119.1 ECF RNA polymerase sigma-E factor [Enhygromyxa salina]
MASDEALYAAWAGGDRRAGGRLIDRHLPSLARFFGAKLSDPSAADDLVAKTFEVCAAKLGSFRGDGTFRAYMFAIAHNHLRNHLRGLQRAGERFEALEISVADLDPTASRLLVRDEQRRLLLLALRSIPIDMQVAIELSYFEEMSRAEIAEVLGIPPGTVAGRLRRGRELLERKIEQLANQPQLRRTTIDSISAWAARLELDRRG